MNLNKKNIKKIDLLNILSTHFNQHTVMSEIYIDKKDKETFKHNLKISAISELTIKFHKIYTKFIPYLLSNTLLPNTLIDLIITYLNYDYTMELKYYLDSDINFFSLNIRKITHELVNNSLSHTRISIHFANNRIFIHLNDTINFFTVKYYNKHDYLTAIEESHRELYKYNSTTINKKIIIGEPVNQITKQAIIEIHNCKELKNLIIILKIIIDITCKEIFYNKSDQIENHLND
jgi:hypothetical protein